MSDIRTIFIDYSGDYSITGPGLEEEDGIETAVIISLFTDRRAEDDDDLPDGDDRRGWWGDIFAEAEGDRIGSRLWLLSREKQLPEVLVRAREYALEALQWMIDDGVASAVEATAEKAGQWLLGLSVTIHRPAKPPAQWRFEIFWKGG